MKLLFTTIILHIKYLRTGRPAIKYIYCKIYSLHISTAHVLLQEKVRVIIFVIKSLHIRVHFTKILRILRKYNNNYCNYDKYINLLIMLTNNAIGRNPNYGRNCRNIQEGKCAINFVFYGTYVFCIEEVFLPCQFHLQFACLRRSLLSTSRPAANFLIVPFVVLDVVH